MTVNQLYSRLKRLSEKIEGIVRFNPQSIRHRVGQAWIDKGANLELVRQKLGHADITTTAMFYANQDRERVKRATKKYSIL
jgi:site-specific recombinase XerD